MNKSLLLFLFIPFVSFGQTTYILEQNNVSAMVSDNNFFFNDQALSNHGYEVPKAGGDHTVYSTSIWMSALDGSGSLHAACDRYAGTSDFFPGPIADDYGTAHYTSTYSSAIWSITQAQIDYHIANYSSMGYSPIPEITDWPGNGDVSEGIAEFLAPYIDANADGMYDPMDGDYPFIQGDEAVYVIMNDAAGTHTTTGADALGVEVHLMFFQYYTPSDDIVNHTTFLNAKIINRTGNSYNDFRMGLWSDFDLGDYSDDFVGTDSVRNMMYVYNSSDMDGGYGANCPAFGMQWLNKPIGSSIFHGNGGGVTGDPSAGPDYYNYMRSTWKDGSHVTYGGIGHGGSTESDFMYTGEPSTSVGWSEIDEGHSGGDRRMVMATSDIPLNSGNEICIDVAFVYSRAGSNQLENVDSLKMAADHVKSYYDNNIIACDEYSSEVPEDSQLTFEVYPNPTSGSAMIHFPGKFEYSVIDAAGKQVLAGASEGATSVQINASPGIYIVEVRSGDSVGRERLVIRN